MTGNIQSVLSDFTSPSLTFVYLLEIKINYNVIAKKKVCTFVTAEQSGKGRKISSAITRKITQEGINLLLTKIHKNNCRQVPSRSLNNQYMPRASSIVRIFNVGRQSSSLVKNKFPGFRRVKHKPHLNDEFKPYSLFPYKHLIIVTLGGLLDSFSFYFCLLVSIQWLIVK